MKLKVTPCTVEDSEGNVVASYDSVVSATAFRHGVEWAEKGIQKFLDELLRDIATEKLSVADALKKLVKWKAS